MVEPLSLAVISGAAGLGLVIGRFTSKKEDPIDQVDIHPHPLPPEPPKLQFIAVEDLVSPNEILEYTRDNYQVFVNVKKLLVSPDKLYKFLHRLSNELESEDMKLYQLSKELVLMTPKKHEIQVKTLKRFAQTELDEKFLPKSIVNY